MIEDTDVKDRYALVETLFKRKENSPISAYVLGEFIVKTPSVDNDGWLTDENCSLLKDEFITSGIAALEEGIFKDTSLELRIFHPLTELDKAKLYTCTTSILNQSGGVIRLANVLGQGVVIPNIHGGVYVEEAKFSDVINFELLRQKAIEVSLESLPALTQAIINSMVDGEQHSY